MKSLFASFGLSSKPPPNEEETQENSDKSKSVATSQLSDVGNNSSHVKSNAKHDKKFSPKSFSSNGSDAVRQVRLVEDMLPDMLANNLQNIIKSEEKGSRGKNIVRLISGHIKVTTRPSTSKRKSTGPTLNFSIHPLGYENITAESGSSEIPSNGISTTSKSDCAEEPFNGETTLYNTLEELERMVCTVPDGAQACAAANLPALLVTSITIIYKLDKFVGFSRRTSDFSISTLDDEDDEIYDDYVQTDDDKDSDGYEEQDEINSESMGSVKENDSLSDSRKRVRRSDVLVSRLVALLCALVGHNSVLLSLIRGPEYGLEKIFMLVSFSMHIEDSFDRRSSPRSAGLSILKAISIDRITEPVIEHIKERNLLGQLISNMLSIVESIRAQTDMVTDGSGVDHIADRVLAVVRVLIRLLRASARTNSILLQNFEVNLGYRLLHSMVCFFPLCVDETLGEIVNLLCLGDGFAEAESEAAKIGAVHPIYRVRNVSAFSIISNLLCQLCSSTKDDSSLEKVSSVFQNYVTADIAENMVKNHLLEPDINSARAYSWDIINGNTLERESIAKVEVDPDQNRLHRAETDRTILMEKDVDSLRLPLLHCVLNIYSANPINFSILDEKFDVMGTLVSSLGSQAGVVHDEFLFMVIKLLELVSMGMDYQPKHVLKILCMRTLPELVASCVDETDEDGDLIGTRTYTNSVSHQNDQADDVLDENARLRSQSLCLDSSARFFQGEAKPLKQYSQYILIMEVLCDTLTKLLRSDDDYKNVLRECGLLSYSLFPFIKKTGDSSPFRSPVLFNMLPMWCSLLCEMLESNSENQARLRTANIHHTLYKLVSCTVATKTHSNGEGENKNSSIGESTVSCLDVLLRLASDDSPSLGQDVAALLELLQKQNYSIKFKQRILETLIEMMRRNHRVKDLWRETSGYETASAVLLSLDYELNRSDIPQRNSEQKLRECTLLIKSVFLAFTVSMSGSHYENRQYMRVNKQYSAIASTCKLIGLFGSTYDKQLVDMIANCATESANWEQFMGQEQNSYRLCLRNPDPFSILVEQIDSLSQKGLAHFLNVLLVLLKKENEEWEANCEILLSQQLRVEPTPGDHEGERKAEFVDMLFRKLDPIIREPNHGLHKSTMAVFESILCHRAPTRTLKYLVRLIYETTPGHSDVMDMENTYLKVQSLKKIEGNSSRTNHASLALLRLLVSVATSSNPLFDCPYVQMVGVHDKVIPTSQSVPRSLRRLKGEVKRSASALSQGNIVISSLGKRSWPPNYGYTFSMWFWLPSYSPPKNSQNSTSFPLFQIRMLDQSQSVKLTLNRLAGTVSCEIKNSIGGFAKTENPKGFARNFLKSKAPEEGHVEVEFSLHGDSKTSYVPKGWHHVLFVHTPEKLLDKTAGGVSLYWDGVLSSMEKCPYFTPVSNGGVRTSVFLGSNPSDNSFFNQMGGQSALQSWRVGPILLADVPLSAAHSQTLFMLGVEYSGSLCRSSSSLRDPRTFTTTFLERLFSYIHLDSSEVEEGYDRIEVKSVAARLKEVGLSHNDWRELLQTASHVSFGGTLIASENVIFAFHAKHVIDLTPSNIQTSSRLNSDLYFSNVASPTSSFSSSDSGTSKNLLVNSNVEANSAHIGQQHLFALVGNGAMCVDPLTISESVCSIGGIMIFFPLLERVTDPSMVATILTLLRSLLFGNEKNRFLFRKQNGHRILAWLLFKHRESDIDIMSLDLLQCMLKMSITGEGEHAFISDPEMLHQLILNHQVWRGNGGPSETLMNRWKSVLMVLHWLTNLVCISNFNRGLNNSVLQRHGIVGWVLEILLLLTVDTPSSNVLFLCILSAALELLENVLTQNDTSNKKSFFCIFEHILVTLPKPVGSPGSTLSFDKVDSSIPSESETQQTEQILMQIRHMLFRLLLDLVGGDVNITEELSNTTKADTLEIFSKVLSMSWFANVLDHADDTETKVLALLLLAKLMQGSADFADHFIEEEGFSVVIRSVRNDTSCISFVVLILLMMVFGIPVEPLSKDLLETQFPIHNNESYLETLTSPMKSEGQSFLGKETKKRLKLRQSSVLSFSDSRVQPYTQEECTTKVNELILSCHCDDTNPPPWIDCLFLSVVELMHDIITKTCKSRLNNDKNENDLYWLCTLILKVFLWGIENFPQMRKICKSKPIMEALTFCVFEEAATEEDMATNLALPVATEHTHSKVAKSVSMKPASSPKRLFNRRTGFDFSGVQHNGTLEPNKHQKQRKQSAQWSDHSPEMFSRPVSQSILKLYALILTDEMGIEIIRSKSPVYNQISPMTLFNYDLSGISSLVVLKNLLHSFSEDENINANQVLWYQNAVLQTMLPVLIPTVDDSVWNKSVGKSTRSSKIGSNAFVGITLPWNILPENLVDVIIFWGVRGSFGWCPYSEHTILELVLQAYRVIGCYEERKDQMMSLTTRLLRSARGLVVWSLETVRENNTYDDSGQLLIAIRRNIETLIGEVTLSSIKQKSKPGSSSSRKRSSFGRSSDWMGKGGSGRGTGSAAEITSSLRYQSVKTLEEGLADKYDLANEVCIFYLCMLLNTFELLMLVNICVNETNLPSETTKFADDSNNNVARIQELLIEIWDVLVSAHVDLVQSIIQVDVPVSDRDWGAWLISSATEVKKALRASILPIWVDVQSHGLFGSKVEAGIPIVTDTELKYSTDDNNVVEPLFVEKRGKLLLEIDNIKSSVASSRFRLKPQSVKTSPSSHVASVEESDLVEKTHEKAVERHLRWKRLALEHLLLGKRSWKTVQEQIQGERSPWAPWGAERLQDHWELDGSEGPYRMRRKLRRNTSFYDTYMLKNTQVVLDEQKKTNLIKGIESDPDVKVKSSVDLEYEEGKNNDQVKSTDDANESESSGYMDNGIPDQLKISVPSIPDKIAVRVATKDIDSESAAVIDTMNQAFQRSVQEKNRLMSLMGTSADTPFDVSAVERKRLANEELHGVFDDTRLRSMTRSDLSLGSIDTSNSNSTDVSSSTSVSNDVPLSPMSEASNNSESTGLSLNTDDMEFDEKRMQSLSISPCSTPTESFMFPENEFIDSGIEGGQQSQFSRSNNKQNENNINSMDPSLTELSEITTNFDASKLEREKKNNTDKSVVNGNQSESAQSGSPSNSEIFSRDTDNSHVKDGASDVKTAVKSSSSVSDLGRDLVDEMVGLGWQGNERIITELDAIDANVEKNPFKVFNCFSLRGMDRTPGICLICKTALYVIDNYVCDENDKNSKEPIREISQAEMGSHEPFRDIGMGYVPSSKKFQVELKLVRQHDTKASGGEEQIENTNTGPSTELVSSYYLHVSPANVVTDDTNESSTRKEDFETETETKSDSMDHKCTKLRYDNVRELHRRRFMFRNVGIEFFAVDGSDFLLVFCSEKDRDWVFTKLLSVDMPNCLLTQSSNTEDTQMLARSSLLQPESLSLAALMAPWQRLRANVTRKWLTGKISNFGYLMYLNTLAGRSHNDLTQYPVFPWVLRRYDTSKLDLNDPKMYRDLSKPMGALDPERVQQAADRYASLASVSNQTLLQPFHYGTHYSCSAYVLHFLIRMEPYTRMALELQSDQFDRPDRLFRSIENTWKSASGEAFNAQDVRELLPEFYYLPEFLENSNKFDFGKTQRGTRVDDVEMPKWAVDCHEFIRLHRKALESSYVSENLHTWIDLIFGYKQRGRAAIAAHNVFHPLTYEGEVDIDAIKDPVIKNATLSQLHNFGMTPRKLFNKAHPMKKVPKLSYESLETADISAMQWHVRFAPPLVIPGAMDRPRASGGYGQPGDVALVKVDVASTRIFGPLGKISDILKFSDKCLAVMGNSYFWGGSSKENKKYKYISWSSVDGTMRVYSTSSTSLAYPGGLVNNDSTQIGKMVATFENLHNGGISALQISEDGKEIWTGGADTVIIVWRIHNKKPNRFGLDQVEILSGHEGTITCIDLSTPQGIAVSGSDDGSAIIWDIGKKTYLRSLYHGHECLIAVSINQGNGNIFTLSRSFIKLWSVNGKPIAEKNIASFSVPTCALATACEVYQHGILVVIGHANGQVTLWDLIYPGDVDNQTKERLLCLRKTLDTGNKAAISCLRLDNKQRRLAVGDISGTIIHFMSAEQQLLA